MLDVGCGDGSLLRILKRHSKMPFSLHGCDLNKEILRPLEDEGITIYPGDFMVLDIPENSFELVLCFHTLEHVPDPKGMLEKMARCLKGGDGKLIIQVPTPAGLNWRLFRRRYWSGYHAPRQRS